MSRPLDLTAKESVNLRVYLYNLVKKGELTRVYPGTYKKTVKPVSVFGYSVNSVNIVNK